MNRRPLLILLAVCCAVALPVRSADEPKLPGLASWLVTTELRASTGYKDNVLLSPAAPKASPLARVEMDVLVMRIAESVSTYDLFLSGSETRYPGVSGDGAAERTWLGRAEWRYELGTLYQWNLAGQVLYQDRVLDLSSLEIGRLVARMQVVSYSLGPEVRLEFLPHWWIESNAGVRVDCFRSFKENFHEPTVRVRLGRKLGSHFELSAAATRRQRTFWDRPAYTLGGRPLSGTHLGLQQQEQEVRAVVRWGGTPPSLTATLRVARQTNRDGESGFFDFEAKRIEAEVTWKRGAWTLIGEARHSRHDYAQQTVGIGFDPAKRALRDTEVSLRIERTLRGDWTVFGDGQWESNHSNEAGASYRVVTGAIGLAKEF